MTKGFRKSKDDTIYWSCVTQLRRAGRQCFRLDGTKRDHPGMPDLLVVWGGGWCLMELKSDAGKLSENQRAFWRGYRGPPGTLVLARSPAEALAYTLKA